MAGQVKITTIVEVTDDRNVAWEPVVVTKTISSLTKFVQRDYSIGTATTQNAWDPLAVDTEVLTDFDFHFAWADGEVDEEFVTDDGAENGKNVDTKRLAADVPLILGADDSYANPGADNAFSGTADLIERLRFRNDSGATRKVKLILAT